MTEIPSRPPLPAAHGRAVDLLSLHLLSPRGREFVVGSTPAEVQAKIASATRALLGDRADGWDEAVKFIESSDAKVPQLRAQAHTQLQRSPERAEALKSQLPSKSIYDAETVVPSPNPSEALAYDAGTVDVSGSAEIAARLRAVAAQRVEAESASEMEINDTKTLLGEPRFAVSPGQARHGETGVENPFSVLMEVPMQVTADLTFRAAITGLQKVVAEAVLENLRANPSGVLGAP